MGDDLLVAYVAALPWCDLHQKLLGVQVVASYDGKTRMGPWAYMCTACFVRFGCGLATGTGQRVIEAQRPAPVAAVAASHVDADHGGNAELHRGPVEPSIENKAQAVWQDDTASPGRGRSLCRAVLGPVHRGRVLRRLRARGVWWSP